MKPKNLIFVLFIMFIPLLVHGTSPGDIAINEIAWMGTKYSSSDEWIELKNNTGQEIDLAGFGIYEKGGDELVVSLSGKIAAGEYYLIERSDDNTISDITANLTSSFGGSGLNNSGEYLTLKDSAGNVINQLDFSSGWPAGIASPDYSSMERDAGGWHTNDGQTRNGIDGGGNPVNGTPGRQNSPVGVPTADLLLTETNSATSSDSLSLTSSGNLSSAQTPLFTADAGDNIVTAVGEEVTFNGSVSHDAGLSDLIWNFGDGNIAKGKAVKHKYEFPGKYIVVLSVSSGQTSASDQLEVSVYSNNVFVSELAPAAEEPWVEVCNSSIETIDLSDWEIETNNGKEKFKIPGRTFIPAGGFLVFSAETMKIKIPATGAVALNYPGGYAVHSVEFKSRDGNVSAARRSDGSFIWTNHKTPGSENIFVSVNDNDISKSKKTSDMVSVDTEREVKTQKAALATIVKTNGGKETVRIFLPKPVFASVENEFVLDQKSFKKENYAGASVIGSFKYWIIIPIIFVAFIYIIRKRYA